jgi:hypothetical protein
MNKILILFMLSYSLLQCKPKSERLKDFTPLDAVSIGNTSIDSSKICCSLYLLYDEDCKIVGENSNLISRITVVTDSITLIFKYEKVDMGACVTLKEVPVHSQSLFYLSTIQKALEYKYLKKCCYFEDKIDSIFFKIVGGVKSNTLVKEVEYVTEIKVGNEVTYRENYYENKVNIDFYYNKNNKLINKKIHGVLGDKYIALINELLAIVKSEGKC